MSLRRRLTLLAAGVVGVTVVLVSVVCYAAMRGELRGQVDDALHEQAELILAAPGAGPGGGPPGAGGGPPGGRGGGFPPRRRFPGLPARLGGSAGYTQVIGPGGQSLTVSGEDPLPVTDEDLEVARGEREELLADRDVDGTHVRVLTIPLRFEGAVQLGRSLEGVDDTLGQLRIVLALLCLGGVALAAVLGRAFSQTALAPVTALTEAAEHVTATQDLGRRIDVAGDDEVGRMASRFNEMLDTLEASNAALSNSVRAQRQLVADASHELRTPVTSLRTNIEVLLDGAALSPDQRTGLLEDVRDQLEELGELITDVIELARGEQRPAQVEEIRLDQLVGEVAARVGRHHPAVTLRTALEPCVVEGVPDRLGRAVANLLDNAAKYGGAAGPVEVYVRDGQVVVRDHGPGVPEADREHLFDRFHRGANAAGRAGSGLGLAIVRQVAVAHGGSVAVEDAPGGGAVFRLRVPAI